MPLLAIISLLIEKCFLTGDRAVCDRGAVILASKNQNRTVTRILPRTMPDQNKRINSERELYQDQNGNTHTRVTRNTETVRHNLPDEYRDGYTHGRIAEASDNGKATRGLLLGLILTSVLGIAGGLLYYLSQRDSEPTTVPVTVPVPSPTATLSPTPTPERTIQTSPTFVPIPQTPATTSPTPEPTINIQPSPSPLNVNPEVNITIPPSPTPTPETPSGQTAPTPTTSPDTNALPGVSGSQSQSQTPTPSPIPTLEAPSLQTAPTAPANQTDVTPQASPDATGSSPSPGAVNP